MVENDTAKQALKSALEARGLCVWPVNNRSEAYKFGLLWGVTLSWPGPDEKIKKEVKKSLEITEEIAGKYNLKPCFETPTVAAGGALVVYCGFRTLLLDTAEKKARERNKTLFQIMDEEAELKEMARGEVQFTAL